MGCICGKPSAIEDNRETRPDLASHVVSAAAIATEKVPVRVNSNDAERRGERQGYSIHKRLQAIGSIPKAMEGEQVTAGWPPWLVAVAGESIRGWVPRRADSFEKLDKIGQGTYSNVYRARDLENGKIVALKKVRFDNLEPESVRFMAREIHILRRLDHPNVVKLEGLVTSRMSCSLYLVFEYMEHDLVGLASFPDIKFTEPQVKCYIQQLLCGLGHCHTRGVLHRDIKGSNLLIDNNGILKIADFGLASFFDPKEHQPLTSRVVTLWYRPPELLLGATNYGVAVDLWSTGCILAELYAGKPIMPGRTEVEQLHKIFKLCGSPSDEYWRKSKLPHATIFKPQQPYRRCVAETFKDFPAPALALIDVLLSVDPADRGTAVSALKSELPEERKLDFLKSLAGSSPYATAQDSRQLLPAIVQLLKTYMPRRKTEETNFNYVECLLYTFHQLAHKTPNSTNSLCGYKIVTGQPSDRLGEDFSDIYKDFTERLNSIEEIVRVSMKKLTQGMADHNKAISAAKTEDEKAKIKAEQHKATTALRACNNILIMTKPLHGKSPSFIGDSKISPSWNELKKVTATATAGAKRTGGPSNGTGIKSPASKMARGAGGMQNQLVNRALEGLSHGRRSSGRGRGFGGRGRGRGYR